MTKKPEFYQRERVRGWEFYVSFLDDPAIEVLQRTSDVNDLLMYPRILLAAMPVFPDQVKELTETLAAALEIASAWQADIGKPMPEKPA